jgi:hypothetical protein
MTIDSRGPRFGAAITTVVLAVVLITVGVSHAVAGWLLLAQTLVFAVGALAGLRYAPYGLIFRYLVRPRLGPPSKTEPEAPPRFSPGSARSASRRGCRCSASSSPRSRWRPRSSTRPSTSASAATCTCSSSESGRPTRAGPHVPVHPENPAGPLGGGPHKEVFPS